MFLFEYTSGGYEINRREEEVSINVEKKHREELLSKLNTISSFIATSVNDLNNEIVQEYIKDIEKEIENRKYGLVFEEHREYTEELIDNRIPVLTEEKELCIDKGGRMNVLIEGDNLAALKILEKNHKEKVDLIIIDPPYNTGRHDLRYYDDFVNEGDIFPHSRWLSFMSKRLKIAAKLLNESGYILINIDENELAQLKLLCDGVFGENNFVGLFMWEKTATPPALSNKVRKKLEYILCYAKKLDLEHQFSQGVIDGGDAPLLNSQNRVKILTFPEGTVNFNISDGIYDSIQSEKVTLIEPVTVKNGTNESPLIIRGRFKWTQETVQTEIENGTVFVVRSRKFLIRYQRFNKKANKIPSNLLNWKLGIGTNETAKKEMEELGIPVFNYSKPTSLYSFLIKMVNSKKNMTVLDFFAGSGTTGEAVLRVNEQTGSNHCFILCTDNQDNICRGTTYERIKRVMEWENYNESLKFYKVDFIDR